MGFRFRKSIKLAPGVKINLNKNSVSATVGTKGAHYTVNSKGKKTTTVGIPGTGISYSTSSGGKKTPKKDTVSDYSYGYTGSPKASPPKKDKNTNGKKWYQKTGWIIFFLIFFFPLGLFLMWKYSSWKKTIKGIVTALLAFGFIGSCAGSSGPTLEQINLSTNTSEAYDINEEIYISCDTIPVEFELTEDAFKASGGTLSYSGNSLYFSADEPGTYTISAEYAGITSNEITITTEDKEAIARAEEEARLKAEEEARLKAEEEARLQAEQEAASQVEQENTYTYILNTNTKKFHYSSCSSVSTIKQKNYGTFEGTRDEVLNKGYEPCGRCHP